MRTPLLSKLSLNWTGLFKLLRVSPSTSPPDGCPVGDKLPYFDMPSHISGPETKTRVSIMRCTPCVNLHNTGDRPIHLPAGLPEYVLTYFPCESPPFYVTTGDVDHDGRIRRVELDMITAHRVMCGRGGKVAVMYETRWKGLRRLSSERKADFQHFRPACYPTLLERTSRSTWSWPPPLPQDAVVCCSARALSPMGWA